MATKFVFMCGCRSRSRTHLVHPSKIVVASVFNY